jgi:hypothetical protein
MMNTIDNDHDNENLLDEDDNNGGFGNFDTHNNDDLFDKLLCKDENLNDDHAGNDNENSDLLHYFSSGSGNTRKPVIHSSHGS